MNGMEQKMKVLVALVLVAVMVGAILLVWNSSATSFHYERSYPSGETKYVRLALDDLEDTNVTVTFTDDPALMYSIDVTLYSAGITFTFEYEERNDYLTVDLVAIGRIESIDVVLGIGTSYRILVRNGANINATIAFGNDAVLGGREFIYTCTGSFHFSFDESVNFTDGGLVATVGMPGLAPDSLYLDIDLPDSMPGEIDFSTYPVVFTSLTGWSHQGFGVYTTTGGWPVGTPGLRISVNCGSCLADLHD